MCKARTEDNTPLTIAAMEAWTQNAAVETVTLSGKQNVVCIHFDHQESIWKLNGHSFHDTSSISLSKFSERDLICLYFSYHDRWEYSFFQFQMCLCFANGKLNYMFIIITVEQYTRDAHCNFLLSFSLKGLTVRSLFSPNGTKCT